MKDVYQAIVTKRGTRSFSDRPISEETLLRLVQAARMAGSAKAAQPVRLIVVQGQEQRDRLAACGNFTPHIRTCQAAVVFVLVPEAGVVGAPFAIFRGPFDAGRAAQNLMVAAWDEGIASCPASMHDAAGAATVLGLPEGHVVANVIALGYPAETPDPVLGTRPRMPAANTFTEKPGTDPRPNSHAAVSTHPMPRSAGSTRIGQTGYRGWDGNRNGEPNPRIYTPLRPGRRVPLV